MDDTETAEWLDFEAEVRQLLNEQKEAARERKDQAAIRRNKQISNRYMGPHADYVRKSKR